MEGTGEIWEKSPYSFKMFTVGTDFLNGKNPSFS